MSRGSPEYKKLRAEADALLEQHAPLIFGQDHAGAAHCKCELAQAYREADDAAWAEKNKPKAASDAQQDWRKMCIVEIAVENQSVRDYVEHWEGRTLKAESEVERLKRELAHAKSEVATFRGF